MISPLAGSVPAYATAPALFFVACLMLRELTELDWDDTTEVIPGRGHRAGDAVHLLDRQRPGVRLHHLCGAEAVHRPRRQVHWMVWLIGGVFLFKFIYIGGH